MNCEPLTVDLTPEHASWLHCLARVVDSELTALVVIDEGLWPASIKRRKVGLSTTRDRLSEIADQVARTGEAVMDGHDYLHIRHARYSSDRMLRLTMQHGHEVWWPRMRLTPSLEPYMEASYCAGNLLSWLDRHEPRLRLQSIATYIHPDELQGDTQ